MSMQYRWYQMWQESHSANFSHLSLACDRLHCLWLSLDTHSNTQYGEPRNLAILETRGQMLSDLTVIKPDSARVPTTNGHPCTALFQAY